MFGGKNQPGPQSKPLEPSMQVAPFPGSPSPAPAAPEQSAASLPAAADAQLPAPQAIVPPGGTPSWEKTDPRPIEDILSLPEPAVPTVIVDQRDISDDVTGETAVSELDLPVGEIPMPIEDEGIPQADQITPEPSDPTPRMRRYSLPAAGTETHVVPAVPYRRDVWIISRGAGGLQASYHPRFIQPDLIDVQVNGIPIPLFAGQDLWMRVINAQAGDNLEISLIIEPRAPGR